MASNLFARLPRLARKSKISQRNNFVTISQTKELKSLLPLPWRKVVDEQSLRAIATAEGSETNNSPNQCGWLTYDWVVSIGKTLDKIRLGMLGIVCILTRGYLIKNEIIALSEVS